MTTEKSSKANIIIAVIGLMSATITAVVANWDKIFLSNSDLTVSEAIVPISPTSENEASDISNILEVDERKLFFFEHETDSAIIENIDPDYANEFSPTSKFIYVDFDVALKNMDLAKEVEFDVDVYKISETEEIDMEFAFSIEEVMPAYKDNLHLYYSLNTEEHPYDWDQGTYQIHLSMNKEKLAEGSFDVL